jgi:hypothetical protein
LTATLTDPIPVEALAAETSSEGAVEAGERRQVGDGAVLVDPSSQSEVNDATEQARRNEQRQQDRASDIYVGAQLVDSAEGGQGVGDGAEVDAGGRQ